MYTQQSCESLLGPGLISIAERLQMSFSTWDIRSRVVWYESSVAQTVILSWMLPWPSRRSLPSLPVGRVEEGKIWEKLPLWPPDLLWKLSHASHLATCAGTHLFISTRFVFWALVQKAKGLTVEDRSYNQTPQPIGWSCKAAHTVPLCSQFWLVKKINKSEVSFGATDIGSDCCLVFNVAWQWYHLLL